MYKRNLELVEDLYEFMMANGYLVSNCSNKIAYFDLFFRDIPDNGRLCYILPVFPRLLIL